MCFEDNSCNTRVGSLFNESSDRLGLDGVGDAEEVDESGEMEEVDDRSCTHTLGNELVDCERGLEAGGISALSEFFRLCLVGETVGEAGEVGAEFELVVGGTGENAPCVRHFLIFFSRW